MSSNTIVLITGASQGIGLQVAKGLGSVHGDYTIVLGSRDVSKGESAVSELKSSGVSSVDLLQLDVTSDSSIASAVSTIESKYGHLDVLINNAGIGIDVVVDATGKHINPNGRTDLSFRELYRQTYDVNVFGAAAVTESFIPLLSKAKHTPRIIFVSSHVGSLTLRSDPANPWYPRAHAPSFPIYRSSKAALNMLTLHYAAKFEEQGWKVNASCPGLTATGFSGGAGRPVSEAAANIVRLAELGQDGETATYSDEKGIVPW
ncbi:carbonyl reductase [Naematelia encephala]|uniref:Carbonyl reductase n=1 Tax=Naematelia encephala TaxID=71784 RepID=A0A1Y2B9D7_9TREE|nr:carbonyl reductase [Naematelia encephala]